MSSLHRTQIYLEKEQIKRLKLEASRKHIAVSGLIRLAIEMFFRTKQRKIDWESDSLTRTVGKIKIKSKDASINHDHYLYGQKKKAS